MKMLWFVVLAALAAAVPSQARPATFNPRLLQADIQPDISITVDTDFIAKSGEFVNVSWSGVPVREGRVCGWSGVGSTPGVHTESFTCTLCCTARLNRLHRHRTTVVKSD